MHFDDRLATVLRLPDGAIAMARIQYLQLVDILGRLPVQTRSAAIDAAMDRLAVLADRIPAADRARLLHCSPLPLTNARLLAVLAESDPSIAGAAFAKAKLDDAQWLALIPSLPVQARGALRHRRDLSPAVETLLDRLGIHDRGLPNISDQVAATGPAISDEAAGSRFNKPTGDIGVDQDVSDDVLELLDFSADPPPPTLLSEWARARAAQKRSPAPDKFRDLVSPSATTDPGIGAIVRRIEEFRRARKAYASAEPAHDAPRLPLGDIAPGPSRLATAIDFETGSHGRIVWAEGPHAPCVVGLDLAGDGGEAVASALRRHLPLRACLFEIDGAPAVAGTWQIDAIARFDPANGQFTGYHGRLRRPAAAAPAAVPGADEADRLRQILHELRTPANAIQVAAEIIQQQLYGPAPHEYRALAASIAGDCAHILAGFEELDRLAKLEAGALDLEQGSCDLAQVLAQTVQRLRAWTDPRGSSFTLPEDLTLPPLPIAIERMEAERLFWRLFAALAGSMAPGESLSLTCHEHAGQRVLDITLPSALAERDAYALFDSIAGERGHSLAAGMFGVGFSLRLASAEATAAGGSLQRDGNALRLSLPTLTNEVTDHSSMANTSY
ncbi:two-component signal transduction histidine kinase [Novosphingobium sp. Rr 2-17]|uniref:HAMP domain-containing histidine kinase n=1 Tax=Novosphingobium sp. Rr 2-17 TaxID=555793 RepID=UPI0002697B3E|nr:HAMP domain-containing histidine kinase [Novosphingobium sp. Rr 2-17]EIZ79517.1 two-component signal transduction histidine kinase [Novosphingobium sp. Rr 2-17]